MEGMALTKADSRPFLSVVIPARDEESRIGRTLEAIVGHLTNRWSFELLVVDDGSGDGTGPCVEGYAQRHPEVRLIRQPAPLGKGAAVRRGVLEAQGERILFSDADLSAPIGQVEKLLSPMESGIDVVIASRALPGSDILIPQPWMRQAAGWAFRWAVKALFRMPFEDTQCGFKCFERRCAQEIFSRSRINGFAFDVEVLLLARTLGFSVAELPIQWADSQNSTVHLEREIFQTFGDLGRIFVRLRLGNGLKLFSPPARGDRGGTEGSGDSHQRLDAPPVSTLHVEETLRQGNG